MGVHPKDMLCPGAEGGAGLRPRQTGGSNREDRERCGNQKRGKINKHKNK